MRNKKTKDSSDKVTGHTVGYTLTYNRRNDTVKEFDTDSIEKKIKTI